MAMPVSNDKAMSTLFFKKRAVKLLVVINQSWSIQIQSRAVQAKAKSVSIKTSAPERAVFIKLKVSGNKRAK
jgi:hypothetical protein